MYGQRVKTGESYTKKFLAETGSKLVTEAVTLAAIYVGGKYVAKHLKTSVSEITDAVKTTLKDSTVAEVAKKAGDVGKAISDVTDKVKNTKVTTKIGKFKIHL